jgi:hypothetical protein
MLSEIVCVNLKIGWWRLGVDCPHLGNMSFGSGSFLDGIEAVAHLLSVKNVTNSVTNRP